MAINRLKENEIIAILSKFKVPSISKSKKFDALYSLDVNNQITNKSTESVISLGVEIDNKLIFDMHISRICIKAESTIKAINRIQK